jgi:hypothetical protein
MCRLEPTGNLLSQSRYTIVHRLHPDVNLDQAQTDIIQEELLKALDANPMQEAPPQFLYSKFAH